MSQYNTADFYYFIAKLILYTLMQIVSLNCNLFIEYITILLFKSHYKLTIEYITM